jgi:formylglycine-generating enzyme required for sulfatase activity
VIGTRKKDAARVAKIIGAGVPAHEINDAPTPTREFYLARYPVTVAQFRVFVDATQRKLTDNNALKDRDNRPVRYVTWHEAMAYCNWLNDQFQTLSSLKDLKFCEHVRSGKWRVTLPSELEWEIAARGGKPDSVFSWGDAPKPAMANYSATGIRDTSAVGCFPANGYGAFDLIGNVWEWTYSLFGPYPYRIDDGREKWETQGTRVLRGGAFNDFEWDARCAYRSGDGPDDWSYSIGFRVVVSPISL